MARIFAGKARRVEHVARISSLQSSNGGRKFHARGHSDFSGHGVRSGRLMDAAWIRVEHFPDFPSAFLQRVEGLFRRWHRRGWLGSRWHGRCRRNDGRCRSSGRILCRCLRSRRSWRSWNGRRRCGRWPGVRRCRRGSRCGIWQGWGCGNRWGNWGSGQGRWSACSGCWSGGHGRRGRCFRFSRGRWRSWRSTRRCGGHRRRRNA